MKSQAVRPAAVGNRLDFFQRRGFIFGRDLFLGDFAVEIPGNRCKAAVEKALVHIAEDDGKTAAGEDVSDAVAHGACADYADSLDGCHGCPGENV